MSFSDIKGHDNITHFFKRELESKRVVSSYLFFGPEGVGKGLLAATLSKALNCLNNNADSCDKCPSCVKIENKNHPDIVFIDAKDEKEAIGISSIRELQERVSLKPYEGRTKVFIIQNSHTMTLEAQNCLLKTLEEPPPNCVIILITSKPEELLLTVKSRCKQIKFGPLELNLRMELVKKEGFLKEDALFLSRLANSGILFSLKPEEKKGRQNLVEYKNNVLNEFNTNSTLLDERSFIFGESKDMLKVAVSIIESWFRDVLILKSGGAASLVINFDRIKDLDKLKDEFSFEKLEDILGEVDLAQLYIERNVSPKMVLNNLKMKILEKDTHE